MSSNTPLVRLRKSGGYITQGDVVRFMSENGMERSQVTISDFERAKYLGPDEFVALYAQAIHASKRAVLRAWKETREARVKASKPKAARRPRR